MGGEKNEPPTREVRFFMLGYEIRHVYGHVEVYWAGEFMFSADNEGEARRELEGA